jgi:thiol-disulfide isomerase/thioredoxin
MATRRFRPRKTARTVRRRRSSTAGKILAPLDVRSKNHLSEFQKRIKKGPLTIIMVWAEWCPHCHTMMPHFDAASKSPNRSIQSIKVEEKMLPSVNSSISKSINKSAKPLNVEGYPSIIVVDKQGNQVSNIQPVRNTETMTKVMDNAGSLAENAGLTNGAKLNNGTTLNANTANVNTVKNNSVANNSVKSNNPAPSEESDNIMNINRKNSIKLNSIPMNELSNANRTNNDRLKNNSNIKNSIAPSPLNTFPEEEPEIKPIPTNKSIMKEAEESTSLIAPLTPPNATNDMEQESISNTLTPEEKLSGGYSTGIRGGSLYSAMARTAYTLAPAAGLLATAAMVMKGRKHRERKTHKRSKKNRKITHRR